MAKKPKKPQPTPTETVPPKVPTTLAELDRAIILLGVRQTVELRQSKRQELFALLGKYPDMHTAKTWKSALKSLRTDEIWATPEQ